MGIPTKEVYMNWQAKVKASFVVGCAIGAMYLFSAPVGDVRQYFAIPIAMLGLIVSLIIFSFVF